MKTRILMIDDDINASGILKLKLEETGSYEVTVENRGSRALAAAQACKPDLIFLDVCMPDADGGDAAFRIRSDPRLQSTPIVFMTSIIMKQEAKEGDTLIGGYPYLAKPARLETIIACITKHLKPTPETP